MSVQEYKCPNCAGNLPFDSASGKMKCPYCEAEFEADALNIWNESQGHGEAEKTEWENGGSEEFPQEELDSLDSNECPSCGVAVVGDKNTIALCCPYCGNTNIVKARVSGMVKPDFVIPFKLDKEAAIKALKKFQEGKRLLPSEFRAEKRIEMIQAVYVPFWLYDCEAKGHINFKTTTVKRWTSGDYDYVKTDTYLVVRGGEMAFEKIPADGSERMDDTLMDSIEPFDYSTMLDFNTAYLSGYLAEKYDIDAEQNKERTNVRIRNNVEQLFKKDVTGYTTVNTESSNVNLENGKVHYALFPVWIINTKYKDKTYAFAMNGQSGKLTGTLPISPQRSAAMFATVFAGLMAVFSAIITFIF